MADILTSYTTDQYITGIKNTLPSGKAWPKDEPESNLSLICNAFAQFYNDIDTLSTELIDEVCPVYTEQLLSIWQETYNLPDSCVSSSSSTENQRNQLLARMGETGGISNTYYENYAKQLGFQVNIKEYGGIIAGLYRCGDTVGTTDDYTYEFDITIETTSQNYSLLECELSQIMPATTTAYYLTVDNLDN